MKNKMVKMLALSLAMMLAVAPVSAFADDEVSENAAPVVEEAVEEVVETPVEEVVEEVAPVVEETVEEVAPAVEEVVEEVPAAVEEAPAVVEAEGGALATTATYGDLMASDKNLAVGKRMYLIANVIDDGNGNEYTYAWSVNNGDYLDLSAAAPAPSTREFSEASVKATKKGKGKKVKVWCTITASNNGDTKNLGTKAYEFKIYEGQVSKVKFSKKNFKINIKKSKLKIKKYAKVESKKGKAYTTLGWYSYDPTIATVDNNGVVRPKGLGTVKIQAYAQDGSGKHADCKVKVYTK